MGKHKDRWRVLVIAVMNVWIHKMRGIFGKLRNCKIPCSDSSPWNLLLSWLYGGVVVWLVN